MTKPVFNQLRPHQRETLGNLHGAARASYLRACVGLAALPLVLVILAAALGVEFALMRHTMHTLLADGPGDQPVLLLALSSLIAIAALHVLTCQPGSEALNRWIMRLGLAALILFLSGFGLIIAMTNYEVAASMLFAPATELDQLDAWMNGAEQDPAVQEETEASFRDAFGEIGGLIALITATLGLGGVFFMTVLVSHYLIGLVLRLICGFLDSRMRWRESGHLIAQITAAEIALETATARLAGLEPDGSRAALRNIVATLTAIADDALACPRHIIQSAELMRIDERTDPLATLGLRVLGLPEELTSMNIPALNEQLKTVETAISEEALMAIGREVLHEPAALHHDQTPNNQTEDNHVE